MADTPAEQPKRRRTTKAAATDKKPAAKRATAAKPRKAAAAKATAETKAEAPKAAPPAAKPRPAPAATAAKPRRTTRRPAPATPAKTPAAAAARKPAPSATPLTERVRDALPERVREALPEVAPRAGLLAALGTVAAVGGAFFIWRASRADEPRYQTIESDGSIEIRKYPALVTAGTEVRGPRQAALNEGFRILADYLFAKSRSGAKIPMTAPVLSDTDRDGSWRTRFIMPADRARAQFPTPPSGVELMSEPAARVAAMRFSGRADDATLESKEGALRSWLQLRGLPSEGKAVHAFYNAPFLPGPFRRNEVMIVLSDEGGTGA